MYNQPIANPSHGLLTALRRMSDFYKRAKSDKQFLTHLQNIIYPLGSTVIDYIGLRYIPQTTQSQEDWQKSFDYVCGWLEKNEKIHIMKSAMQLRKALNQKFPKQFELDVGAGDFVLLTIISAQFQGKTRNERLQAS